MSAIVIPIPRECRQLVRRGALVAINSSGGKDSQAMTILLSRIAPSIVPRDQLILVHAPLGEVEWPGTIEHIERTMEIVSWRARAFAPGAHVLDRILERWPLAA